MPGSLAAFATAFAEAMAVKKATAADVPETGFEPARRFQRYHLKVVRLPISPPGLECFAFRVPRFALNPKLEVDGKNSRFWV